MGLTYTAAVVESIDSSGEPVEARFLVDTGAIDCLLATSLLKKAGIHPQGTALYELANGQVEELAFSWARLKFMDTEAMAKVVFGPEGAEPILGVIALESAGVAVDPVSNTLKRLAVRSLKKAA